MGYDVLPEPVRARAEATLPAAVVRATPVGGGFSATLTVDLRLADGGRAFLKACPDGSPSYETCRVEGWFGRRAPDGLPAPPLLGRVREAGWLVLLFGWADGRSPLRVDRACRGLLRRLAAVRPAPALAAELPPVSVALGHLTCGWSLIGGPGRLVRLEREWPALAAGDGLVHTDLSAGNVRVAARPGVPDPSAGGEPGNPPGGARGGSGSPDGDGAVAVAVDWSRPALGAGWVDAVLLALRLGDTAALSGRLGAPEGGVESLVAGAAGHWTWASRQPEPEWAPGLRAHEAACARTALSWLGRRDW